MHPLNPVIQLALYARLGFDPAKLSPDSGEFLKINLADMRPVGDPIAGWLDEPRLKDAEIKASITYTQTQPLPSVYPKASSHIKGCALRTAMTCAVGIECEHGYDVCPQCDKCTCDAIRAQAAAPTTPKPTEGLLDNDIKPFWVK